MRKIMSIMVCLMLLYAVMGIVVAAAESMTLALPANTQVISEEAFMGNTSIREVEIPEGTLSIESKAFSSCTELEKVTINSRDVQIMTDAFDGCPNVNLYVYRDSTAEAFAIENGIAYTLIDGAEPVHMDLMDMIGQYSIAASGLQGGNNRFIVCTNGGVLPDLSDYHPVAIAEGGDNIFFIQFGDDDSSEIDANNCYEMLKGLEATGEVAYVEPDAVAYVTNRGEDSGSVSQAGIMTWDDDDPMGFDEYSAYVAGHQSGKQVIAVIDAGIRRSSVYNSMLSSQSFNAIPDGQDAFYSGRNHGSFIASIIHDCVGDANVKIMSVRAVDDKEETLPSIFGMAIEKAVEAGADIINISYILPYSKYVEDALRRAASNHVTIVIAAGNYNGSTADFFPANAKIGSNKIVVSGLEDADRVWSRTNTGPQVTYCAPAAGIRTSYATIGEGTSFAAPMIASAFALVDLDTTHGVSDMNQTCKTDIGLNGKTNQSQAIGLGMPQLGKLAATAVTDIIIENAPSIMKVGDSVKISYSVEPENATNKTISFASSSDSILQIQEAGNGVWGEWSEWSTTQRTITDPEYIQERTKTQHLWYRYVCSNCGACMHAYNIPCYTWAGGCGETGTLTVSAIQTDLTSIPPSEGIQNWCDTGYIAYGDDAGDRWFYSDAIVSYSYRYKGSGANELVLNAVRRGSASVTFTANDDSDTTKKLDIQVVQPVTSVRINSDATELLTSKTLTLSVNVLPSSADNKNISWSSSNTSIATVSSTGVVTPVSGGTVVIRAEAKDGYGAADEFTLTIVEIPDPESIDIIAQNVTLGDDDTLELAPGDKLRLTATVYPDDAIQTVVWSAKSIPANANVVTIDSKTGQLTAVNTGSAVITATSTEKGAICQQVSILVQVKSTGITISGAGEVKVGETIPLTATVMPENASNKSVVWSSSNPSIATVNQSGVVTGVKNGLVEIIATSQADSSIRQQKLIVVKQMPVSISISGTGNLFIENGNESSPAQNGSALTATVSPSDTYDKSVTWSSSNTKVATVDSTGFVTTVGEGTTVITATCNADSRLKATMTVIVKNRWKAWSAWSDTSVSGTTTKQVETRTMYKSTTTSYGAWGSWSQYQLNAISGSDTTNVESANVWTWVYTACPYCGFHMWANCCNCASWAGGCGKWIGATSWVSFYLPISHYDGNAQWNFGGVGSNRVRYYDTTYGYGWIYGQESDHNAKTGYRYRTRSKNVSESGWQTTPISPVNTNDLIVTVSTKTQYRYREQNTF